MAIPVALGDEVVLELGLGPDAVSIAPLRLDVSALSGAEASASRAWQVPGGRLDLSCARADTWAWIDGLEGPLLDGASALARKHLALPSLSPGPITRDGPSWSQPFSGEAMSGLHLLAFRGDQAHLCSIACRGACDPPTAAWQGISAPPATPALIAGAIAHPGATFGVTALLCVAVSVAILYRRPRRPRSSPGFF